MSDTFPLLLKEGWPDHFLIMIQMLVPSGVVDCCGFSTKLNYKLFCRIKRVSYEVIYSALSSEYSSIINHPDRERKYCIYMRINRPDHPSFKRRGNFIILFFINPKSLS
jgi:hypothetical protein